MAEHREKLRWMPDAIKTPVAYHQQSPQHHFEAWPTLASLVSVAWRYVHAAAARRHLSSLFP